MFTYEELNKIDRDYFNVLNAGCYSITLQSKNTQHYWHITSREYCNHTFCEVLHKHNKHDAYHRQLSRGNLAYAISHIKDHDRFQLSGRKKKATNQ